MNPLFLGAVAGSRTLGTLSAFISFNNCSESSPAGPTLYINGPLIGGAKVYDSSKQILVNLTFYVRNYNIENNIACETNSQGLIVNIAPCVNAYAVFVGCDDSTTDGYVYTRYNDSLSESTILYADNNLTTTLAGTKNIDYVDYNMTSNGTISSITYCPLLTAYYNTAIEWVDDDFPTSVYIRKTDFGNNATLANNTRLYTDVGLTTEIATTNLHLDGRYYSYTNGVGTTFISYSLSALDAATPPQQFWNACPGSGIYQAVVPYIAIEQLAGSNWPNSYFAYGTRLFMNDRGLEDYPYLIFVDQPFGVYSYLGAGNGLAHNGPCPS